MSAGETTYEQISGPGDYENVNPLAGNEGAFFESLQGLIGNMQNFMGQGFEQAGGYDPNAFMQQFLGAVPGLMGATTAATAPLAQAHQESLLSMVDPTVAAIGQELAPMGAAHSSAFGTLATEAMAPHITQAATNLAGQQSNIFGNLAANAMGLYGQGNQYASGLGMQGAGIASGLLGNLFGTGAGMLEGTHIGPMMAANYEPSWWETWGQPLLGAGATVAGGALG